MPFTFTPSGRMALMKASAALAVALMGAACEVPSRRPTDPNPPNAVVRVFAFPHSTVLLPLDTRQFLAYGRTQLGDSVDVSVSWSATGGIVSTGGVYTAGSTPGAYRLIVTQSGGMLADTASVTVTAPPPPP